MSQLGRAAPPGFVAAPAPTARPVRADPVAAALLLVAGAIGIWQLLLPWLTVATASGPAAGGGVTPPAGRSTGCCARWHAGPRLSWATLAVLGCAVGGGALVVLGLAMMAPINHRPLGGAALLVSLLSMVGARWMVVIRARTIFDVGVFGAVRPGAARLVPVPGRGLARGRRVLEGAGHRLTRLADLRMPTRLRAGRAGGPGGRCQHVRPGRGRGRPRHGPAQLRVHLRMRRRRCGPPPWPTSWFTSRRSVGGRPPADDLGVRDRPAGRPARSRRHAAAPGAAGPSPGWPAGPRSAPG